MMKKLSAILLILVFFAGLSGCQATPERYYKRGCASERIGHYSEAKYFFSGALNMDPGMSMLTCTVAFVTTI
jgi:hypothetical protein